MPKQDHRALPLITFLESLGRVTVAQVSGSQAYLDQSISLADLIQSGVDEGLFDEILPTDSTLTITDRDGTTLYTVNVPNGSTLTQVINDATLTVRDEAGSGSVLAEGSYEVILNNSTGQISATYVSVVFDNVAETATITFADIDTRINGIIEHSIPFGDLRGINLEDSAGNTITQDSSAYSSLLLTIVFADIPVTIDSYGAADDILLSWDGYTILIIDQEGTTVVPTAIDNTVAKALEITLPGLVGAFTVTDQTPTVGETLTFTDTSTGAPSSADRWAWDFGDGTFGQVENPTKQYLIPGVYDVHQFTGVGGSNTAGFHEEASYITAAGILDTYTGGILSWGNVLFYRTSTDDFIRLRETGGGTTDEIPYTSAESDQSAITTHTGANDGSVERVYMQDGSGRFFTQSTTGDQPELVSSGSILTVNNIPALQFDGINHYMTMTGFSYWGGDRSKIYIAAVIKPSSTLIASGYFLAHWVGSGNQRSWAILHDGTTNQLLARYTTDGTSGTDQVIAFNSLTAGETCVIGVQIDTAQAADDRIKAWKNGTALTFASRTGSSTGNLHDSTANLNLGTINNGTSASAYYEGDLLGFLVIPSDQTANRAAIEQYLMDYHSIT